MQVSCEARLVEPMTRRRCKGSISGCGGKAGGAVHLVQVVVQS